MMSQKRLYLYYASIIVFLFTYSLQLCGQYPNIRISKPNADTTSQTPEEVTIAVNPRNPLNIVAGANSDFYYYSTDGGTEWSQGKLSSPYGVEGDPCVVFDALGTVYFAHLSNFSNHYADRIVVQRSTDGGHSWNEGTGVGNGPPGKIQDKEWLAVDMTDSKFKNNLYVAWTQFDKLWQGVRSMDSSRILFAASSDGGTSWSSPVRVSDSAGDCHDSSNSVEGAVPAIGPSGEVYLSWAGPLGIMFDKSLDGGKTFGKDVFVTAQPGGWYCEISGLERCNGQPVTACDRSNSLHRGTIYIQWSDQRNGPTNTDIFLIKSTDGGTSWGGVKKFNDDTTTRQQFFSWMTVEQSNGYIYIIFYDRRNTSGDATDVYVARSTDGGDTFVNFKISRESFTPSEKIFFGDYINITTQAGIVRPIWMRLDGDRLSVWTAIIK